MSYVCHDCGRIVDRVKYEEGEPICPYCRSANVDNAPSCQCCKEPHYEHDLIDGYCKDCFNHATTPTNVVEYCDMTGKKKAIDLNAGIVGVLTAAEIERIIKLYMQNVYTTTHVKNWDEKAECWVKENDINHFVMCCLSSGLMRRNETSRAILD